MWGWQAATQSLADYKAESQGISALSSPASGNALFAAIPAPRMNEPCYSAGITFRSPPTAGTDATLAAALLIEC
jgi:hypothetical protein